MDMDKETILCSSNLHASTCLESGQDATCPFANFQQELVRKIQVVSFVALGQFQSDHRPNKGDFSMWRLTTCQKVTPHIAKVVLQSAKTVNSQEKEM